MTSREIGGGKVARLRSAMQSRLGSRIAGWATLGVVSWAGIVYARHVPRALPAYASPTAFSGHRATSVVQALTTYPHPIGSSGALAAQGYIIDQLQQAGVSPFVQTTTAVGTRYAVAGRVHNVLARLPGSSSQPNAKAVLLMAHYDAVPASPGAGDDGAGVATLLETLRALRSSPQLRNDVIFLFTDGEEPGLLGAAAFVREHPWARDVGVVLNFEARGTHGPSLMFETGPGNLDVVRALRRIRGVRATSLSTAVYRSLPNDTDLSELALLGLPAMNFAFIGGVDRYHTAQDDPSNLDARSVQHHGDQALALVRAFGNAPLPRPHTSDAVFFDFPLLGLVVYPAGYAIVFALLALMLTVVAIMRSWTGTVPGEGRGARGLLMGALATVVGTLISAVLGFALAAAMQRIHVALQSGTPDLSAMYAATLVLAAIATVLAGFELFGRRRGAGMLATGAVATWTIIAVVAAVAAPGVSYVFVWPAVVMAAALVVNPATVWRRPAVWVGATLSVLLIAPIVYQMAYVALGINQIGGVVIGVFVGLLTALLIPVLGSSTGEPGDRWLAPVAAVAGCILCLAIGAFTVRTDADHPAGVSLVYATDPDSAGAWLTGYSSSASGRARLGRFLRDVEAQSGSAAGPLSPSWLRQYVGYAPAVPAPHFDLPHLQMAVVSDSTAGTERRVAIRFRPAPGVYMVSMSSSTGPVISATVDGKPIRTDRHRRRSSGWELTYVAPSDSGFVVGLVVAARSRVGLAISTRSQGIPPLTLPERPDGIVQYQGGNTTLMRHQLQL